MHPGRPQQQRHDGPHDRPGAAALTDRRAEQHDEQHRHAHHREDNGRDRRRCRARTCGSTAGSDCRDGTPPAPTDRSSGAGPPGGGVAGGGADENEVVDMDRPRSGTGPGGRACRVAVARKPRGTPRGAHARSARPASGAKRAFFGRPVTIDRNCPADGHEGLRVHAGLLAGCVHRCRSVSVSSGRTNPP